MKKGIIAVFLFATIANGQNNSMTDAQILKWKKAVINIETVPSFHRYFMELSDLLRERKITRQQRDAYEKELLEAEKPRYTGTVIYLKYNDHHYLLTAKHVLQDLTAIDNQSIFPRIIFIHDSTTYEPTKYTPWGNGNIEVTNYQRTDLFNFSVGRESPFSFHAFSEIEDVALLRLDVQKQGSEILTLLKKKGYEPISFDDIDTTGHITANEDISCMGYPKESFVKTVALPNALRNYESNQLTLPLLSKGKISAINLKQHSFEADIFVYHGMSGGPVIANNKLIGIVSRGEFEHRAISTGNLNTYILNHSIFVKASLVIELLQRIEERKLKTVSPE